MPYEVEDAYARKYQNEPAYRRETFGKACALEQVMGNSWVADNLIAEYMQGDSKKVNIIVEAVDNRFHGAASYLFSNSTLISESAASRMTSELLLGINFHLGHCR